MSTVAICDPVSALRRTLAERVASVPMVGRVDVVDDIAELVAFADRSPPSVVLLSSQLTSSSADSAVRLIRQTAPSARILLLTMGTDPDEIVAGLTAGADGYLARDASLAELAAAFVLLPRQPAVPPQIRRDDAEQYLSQRERQVLEGMSRGRSNAEIGEELFLSEDTIKTHARRLFRKLGVNDRAHAVAEGFRRGLLG